MTEKKDLTRKELEEKIINKALEDKNFKKQLLTNPHEAIAQLGFEVPKEMEIKILEESAQTSYLVLPHKPEELSDDTLDLVAGGAGCNCNRDPNSSYYHKHSGGSSRGPDWYLR